MTTWVLGPVEINWLAALVLGTAVALDLAARWLAFRQLESVAIDCSLFGLLYSVIEELMPPAGVGGSVKIVLGFIIWAGLTIIHVSLTNRLQDQVKDVLRDVRRNVTARRAHQSLEKFEDIASRFILVALAARKRGKRDHRNKLAAYLNSLPVGREVKPEEFLLPPVTRRLVISLFILGGTAGLFLPVGGWR